MNIPSSETTPDGFTSLPPEQRRHFRLVIQNATAKEVNDYLTDLMPLCACGWDHYIFLLASAAALVLSIGLNAPILLLIALLAAPTASPLVGIPLSAMLPSWAHFFRSLVCLLISAAVYFGAGWLTGMGLTGNASEDFASFAFLLENTWLEWVLVLLAGFLFGWLFLRKDSRYRLFSAFLTGMIFFPLAISGFMFQAGADTGWLAIVLTVLSRAAAAVVLSLVGFWLSGVNPRGSAGWLILVGVLALLGLAVFGFVSQEALTPAPTAEPTQAVVQQTSPAATQPAPTATAIPPTPVPTRTQVKTTEPTPTQPPTPEPTPIPVAARISSENGVVVRAEPSSKAMPVTYLNYWNEVQLLGEEVLTDTVLWQKVLVSSGETGWIVGRYLQTATPQD